jgi:hypothetical protein
MIENSTNIEELCKHIECQEKKCKGWEYCIFHRDGGILGKGDTYDQYEIIEQDFIDFIKVIPINEESHLKVHSPVLRDIIIRSCVQIEMFFKEWAKKVCSENPELPIFQEYNRIDRRTGLANKGKYWKFKDYSIFRNEFQNHHKVYVRPLDREILPFESWTAQAPPNWWAAYNSIKHDGIFSKKQANLENALFALAALFLMHCKNRESRNYLEQFRNVSISNSFSTVKVEFHGISSPIDSKKYLFKEVNRHEKKIELITKKQFENRNKSRL